MLGPFLPPEEVTDAATIALSRILRAARPIAVAFRELRLLGTAACLIPEPTTQLERLTVQLQETWPNVATYQAVHHLTVARNCDDAHFVELHRRLQRHLPLMGTVRESVLLARDDCGDVTELGRFRLGR